MRLTRLTEAADVSNQRSIDYKLVGRCIGEILCILSLVQFKVTNTIFGVDSDHHLLSKLFLTATKVFPFSRLLFPPIFLALS